MGLSVSKARDLLSELGFTNVPDLLQLLGVNALDAKGGLELMGIEAEQVIGILTRLGYSIEQANAKAGELSQKLLDRRAAEEAEKAAKKAEQDALDAAKRAEEAAQKAREQIVANIGGARTRDLLGGIRSRGTESSAQAAGDILKAVDGLDDLHAAGLALDVALQVIDRRVLTLAKDFGELSGDDSAAAGAALDAITQLNAAFARGDLDVATYQKGLQDATAELDRLGAKVDEVRSKRADAVVAALMGGGTVAGGMADFAKGEWLTSVERNVKDSIVNGLKAGMSAEEVQRAIQPGLDVLKAQTFDAANIERVKQDIANSAADVQAAAGNALDTARTRLNLEGQRGFDQEAWERSQFGASYKEMQAASDKVLALGKDHNRRKEQEAEAHRQRMDAQARAAEFGKHLNLVARLAGVNFSAGESNDFMQATLEQRIGQSAQTGRALPSGLDGDVVMRLINVLDRMEQNGIQANVNEGQASRALGAGQMTRARLFSDMGMTL